MKSPFDSLRIYSPDELLFHEKVEHKRVERLVEEIPKNGLHDPIIVERSSLLILDGAHRATAMKTLRFDIVCQIVDYKDVKLDFWKISVEPLSIPKTKFSKERLDSGELAFGYFDGEKWWGIEKTTEDLFSSQEEILNSLEHSYSERPTGPHLIRKEFSKEEIINLAKSKKLFPPKYTRHMVKGRIIRLDIPPKYLKRPEEFLDNLDYSKFRHYEESTLVYYNF